MPFKPSALSLAVASCLLAFSSISSANTISGRVLDEIQTSESTFKAMVHFRLAMSRSVKWSCMLAHLNTFTQVPRSP